MHDHEHAPEARGLRAARRISAVKGGAFLAISIATANPGLAVVSGHDLGDAWALGDEAHASESCDRVESAKLMRRAANKIMGFTLVAGATEIAAEVLLNLEHNDEVALAAHAASFGLDALGRHKVLGDHHHSHNGIGHDHVNSDVASSGVTLIGTLSALLTENRIGIYLGTAVATIITIRARGKIYDHASRVESAS